MLKPHQIVGVVALLVFGGLLVRQLLAPRRDPFHLPGAMRMDEVELPSPAVPILPPPVHASPPDGAVSETRDLFAIGPQDARDDLYCSGLIYAHHRASGDTLSPEAQRRRDKIIALAESGVAKLLASGAAAPGETAAIADAHGRQAMEDFARGAARFSLEECLQR